MVPPAERVHPARPCYNARPLSKGPSHEAINARLCARSCCRRRDGMRQVTRRADNTLIITTRPNGAGNGQYDRESGAVSDRRRRGDPGLRRDHPDERTVRLHLHLSLPGRRQRRHDDVGSRDDVGRPDHVFDEGDFPNGVQRLPLTRRRDARRSGAGACERLPVSEFECRGANDHDIHHTDDRCCHRRIARRTDTRAVRLHVHDNHRHRRHLASKPGTSTNADRHRDDDLGKPARHCGPHERLRRSAVAAPVRPSSRRPIPASPYPIVASQCAKNPSLIR